MAAWSHISLKEAYIFWNYSHPEGCQCELCLIPIQPMTPLALASPWDGLDLDLVPPPPEVSRLKLEVPSHYLAILPNRSGKSWEERWDNAKNASEICAIISECDQYEEKNSKKLRAFRKPSDQVDESSSRKRSREDYSHYIPRAKRVRLITENTGAKSPPIEVLDDVNGVSILSNGDILYPDPGPYILNRSQSPQQTVSITAQQFFIHMSIRAMWKLAERAELIEKKLLAMQTWWRTTTESSEFDGMTQAQLEEKLKETQTSASKLVAELDSRGKLVNKKLGFGSPPVAEYMAEDPRRLLFSSTYCSTLEWQIKEYGVFGWWTAQMGGELD